MRAAELVVKVQPPTLEEVDLLTEGLPVLSFLAPSAYLDVVRQLASRKITAYSFELVPRISRAQVMDALSSQATVAGYKAVLLAANRQTKFFPLFMTAAGTVPPAHLLVMGAGVAGLQAIATARRLGAVVSAYDVRTAARDEVKSLGATFLELPLEAQEGSGGYAASPVGGVPGPTAGDDRDPRCGVGRGHNDGRDTRAQGAPPGYGGDG